MTLAQTTLRVLRTRHCTVRVAHIATGDILHVGPREKLTPELLTAIVACKPALIALLDADHGAYVRVEDAQGNLVRAMVDLGACPGCGGNDRRATADGQNTECVPCTDGKAYWTAQFSEEIKKLESLEK